MHRAGVSISIFALVACGASSHPASGDDDDIGDWSDGDGDADSDTDVGSDAGADSNADVDVADNGPATEVDHYCGDLAFPVFDRSCEHTYECALVEHQSDCCGSIRWMGVPSRLAAEFDAAEAQCRASYEECHCDPSYAVEEDADYDVGGDDRDVIAASCMAGEYCLSLIP